MFKVTELRILHKQIHSRLVRTQHCVYLGYREEKKVTLMAIYKLHSVIVHSVEASLDSGIENRRKNICVCIVHISGFILFIFL